MDKKSTNNILAVVGFVISFFFSIPGLVLSIVGLCQIKKTNESGKGLAIAGIIISGIKIFLILCFIIFTIVFAAALFPSIQDEITASVKCSNATNCSSYCSIFDEDCLETCEYCSDGDCETIYCYPN